MLRDAAVAVAVAVASLGLSAGSLVARETLLGVATLLGVVEREILDGVVERDPRTFIGEVGREVLDGDGGREVLDGEEGRDRGAWGMVRPVRSDTGRSGMTMTTPGEGGATAGL